MPKISITFKTPDAIDRAVDETVDEELEGVVGTEDELEEVREEKSALYKQTLQKWIRYGELVTIEFDIGAGTATVVAHGR